MRKSLFMLALLLIPAFMFAGCGDTANNANKIILSEVTHSIFYAPLYIAMNNGYFTDEGIEIELVNGNGSNNVMTALVSGSATIGLAGPETAVYTAQQSDGSSPKVFGQLTACDGSFLVGREADPDFTLEDLRGKTIIAGRRGGMPAMTLEYALAQHGMIAGRDYTLNLDYEFGMVATVFESGIGDYCTMFEPVASEYEAGGHGAIVASIGKMGGYVPYTAFIATEEYLEENSLTAERFLRAVYRGYLYLMNAPINDVVKALVPQFADSSEAGIKAAIENYKELNAFASSPVMTEDGYNLLCNIIRAAGQLEGSVDFNKVIDNTIANKVVNYFQYA